jgi:hypothetical protein
MRKSVFFIVTFAAVSLFAGEAAVARQQTISQESAQALCKGHGGGTECAFCHGDHCHLVQCDSHGKCTNIVPRGNPSKTGAGPVTVGGSKQPPSGGGTGGTTTTSRSGGGSGSKK